MSLWQDYLATQFDPAHLLSELGFTLVFDGLLAVLWRRLLKPRLIRQAHREIDASHGMAHPDGLPLTAAELSAVRAIVRARLSPHMAGVVSEVTGGDVPRAADLEV